MFLVNAREIITMERAYPHKAGAFSRWRAEVKQAVWRQPKDIKADHGNASFLPDNQVVFNVGGSFRIVVHVAYSKQTVMVVFAGTHTAYDRWNRGQR